MPAGGNDGLAPSHRVLTRPPLCPLCRVSYGDDGTLGAPGCADGEYFGNEASQTTFYSRAALTVIIPPASGRDRLNLEVDLTAAGL